PHPAPASRRGGRPGPGGRRPPPPPDRGQRRADRQGRPLGPPPACLPDRPVPRRLVPHHPVRGAVRRDRRDGADAPDQRGGPPPPRDPRRATGPAGPPARRSGAGTRAPPRASPAPPAPANGDGPARPAATTASRPRTSTIGTF